MARLQYSQCQLLDPQDGETPYNVAGKNMKVRKLITQLLNANLDDSDEDKGDGGEGDEEEWEEVAAEEEEKAAK